MLDYLYPLMDHESELHPRQPYTNVYCPFIQCHHTTYHNVHIPPPSPTSLEPLALDIYTSNLDNSCPNTAKSVMLCRRGVKSTHPRLYTPQAA
jgi:hypothetical protein